MCFQVVTRVQAVAAYENLYAKYNFIVTPSITHSLPSMDVETTNQIHHLIFGGGIVRGCTVLSVIDMYGHRWDTEKRSCFLCSKQHVHAAGDDAHLQFYPALLA